MQDLSPSVSAIIGAIVGGVVGAGAPLFIDWWYRPMLKLEADSPEPGMGWSGHAIAVTNRGLRTAKNCHGMMKLNADSTDLCPDNQLIYVKDLGQGFAAKFNVPTQETFLLNEGSWRPINDEMLAWAQLGNPWVIDVYPDTHPLLDVFRFIHLPGKLPQLQFVSEGGWARPRGAFRLKNEYSLTITVGAENARATSQTYRIYRKGDDVAVELTPKPAKPWWRFGLAARR